MARKKKHPEHVNHERWLVSYADFITLLFAFFVVMFAVSQVDSKKVGRFTESFHDALEWQVLQESKSVSGAGKEAIPLEPLAARAGASHGKGSGQGFDDEKASIRRGLARRLANIPLLAGLNVLEVHGELVLRLPEKLMFDRGDAILHPEGGDALVVIAEELEHRPVRVRVEGHTDLTPIHTPRFPSNWELSQSRSMAVVRFFLENGKIAPARLAAAGYGEYHPIATNDTPEGKAKNRRVDLCVVADLDGPKPPEGSSGPKVEPAAKPEPGTDTDPKPAGAPSAKPGTPGAKPETNP